MQRSVVVGVLAVVGCSSEVAPKVGANESNIVGGAPSTADPAVVALILRRVQCAQQSSFLSCSGVLIAPRVVLTAAHCLAQFAGPAAIEVAFGASANGLATRYVVVSAGRRHAKYNRDTRAYDAALLRLAEPAPVEPFDWRNAPAPVDGMRLRAVGFGSTGARLDPDGLKRTGTMMLLDSTAVSFRAKPDPALSCSGDSGGPVFTTVDGVERLIGLSVSGDTDCAKYAGNTRMDILTDFIETFEKDTAVAPIGPSKTGAALDTLCSATCRSDAECPALMPCMQDGTVGRCQLTEPAAKYGAACTTDDQCGGATCARLWPSGPDSCRCATPCSPGPTQIVPPTVRIHAGGGGCAASGERGLGTPGLIFLFGALVRWRRHRQRNTRVGAGDQ